MADQRAVGDRDQRQAQRAGLAQGIDDRGLVAAGVRRIMECGGDERGDRRRLVRVCVADLSGWRRSPARGVRRTSSR
jgi:hypothetical protein